MKVLNYGSLNYDYVYQVEHIMRPGETQSSSGMATHNGGKGLNQSIAVARAGIQIYHAGAVGEEGKGLLDCLKADGVDCTYVKELPGKSGHTIIQVDKDAQNCILLFGGANRSQTKEQIDEVFANFDEGDILILQNEVNELAYIIDKAAERKMQIILNPSPYDDYLASCDMTKISYFVMNEVEGGDITGETDPDKILEKVHELYPHAKVLLTLGKDGAVYTDYENKWFQGSFNVKAVDTTAAGDTFTGYFVAGIVNGWDMGETLKLCAKASAIAVSRPGAAPSIPKYEEVISTEL